MNFVSGGEFEAEQGEEEEEEAVLEAEEPMTLNQSREKKKKWRLCFFSFSLSFFWVSCAFPFVGEYKRESECEREKRWNGAV